MIPLTMIHTKTGFRRLAPAVLASLLASGLLLAAVARADAATESPRDVAYPGTIELLVDVSDIDRRVFEVTERLPVTAGALRLLYPRWLPGNHAPSGPIQSLAGLTISAGATRLEWQRDALDMHAFDVVVPSGVTELELRMQFVTPVAADQGRRVVTPDLLSLQWEKALLYPAGHFVRRISVRPTIRLPAGWEYASALEGAKRTGATIEFAVTTLERLVDSPLYAGRYARRIELDTDAKAPVSLQVFADRPELLAAKPEQVDAHRKLVAEAVSLFGSRHYRHYDFLLVLSEHFAGVGLEHQQSSENGVGPGYFTEWDTTAAGRDLLAHEYVHSWNGKFRRPADLWTPSYNVPMRNSLLWMYEGMTEYWGNVLSARSGLWSTEFARDALAQQAATMDRVRDGRAWRNLQDTTNQPIMAYRASVPFQSWQRGTDYYTESVFLWLDVDTRIRALTRERRSLDDFARAFFGVQDGQLDPVTYVFDDLIAALNALAPYDWRGFLRARLDGQGPGAPLEGIARAGWKLVYDDKPSAYTKSADLERKRASFTFSLGISVANEGSRITEVVWGSPAFKAGMATGTTLVAVAGRAYSAERLREAVERARQQPEPIELLIRRDDLYQTVRIDYRDGLRYPRLERIESAPDRLGAILKPRT